MISADNLDTPYRTINARKRSVVDVVAELWKSRDLFWVLTIRDLKVQYNNTLLGLGWALLKPILTIAILSFIFGTVAGVGTGEREVPHLVYTSVGLLGWFFFADVIGGSISAIASFQDVIKKVYFPKLLLPFSKILVASIDLLLLLCITIVLMIVSGVHVGKSIVALPFVLLLVVASGMAGALWVGALSIRYVDFKHITPFVLRIGMYASPVAYSSAMVPDAYKSLYYLNPLVGVIDLLRWCLLGDPITHFIFVSCGTLTFLLISGLFYFSYVERKIVDII